MQQTVFCKSFKDVVAEKSHKVKSHQIDPNSLYMLTLTVQQTVFAFKGVLAGKTYQN